MWPFLFQAMERALISSGGSTDGSKRRKQQAWKQPGVMLQKFKRIVRSILLLLKCFRMRQKCAVITSDLSYEHEERYITFVESNLSTLSLEMRMIFGTPPHLRGDADVKKAAVFLRACGAVRAMLGHTSPEDDEKFARCLAYERYDNGRVLAQQGRKPDRFYFFLSGKVLVIQDYHVANNVISKTIRILSKGKTSDVDEIDKGLERANSLVCKEKVEAFVLDCDDYFKLRRDKSEGAKEYLSSHNIFHLFPSHLMSNERNELQLQYYPDGAVIHNGGRRHDWIYIVKTGQCSMVRTQLVPDVYTKKKSLFNKPTAHELGCDRRRNSYVPKAAFCVWKSQSEYAQKNNYRNGSSRSRRSLPSATTLRAESKMSYAYGKKRHSNPTIRIEDVSNRCETASLYSQSNYGNFPPVHGTKSELTWDDKDTQQYSKRTDRMTPIEIFEEEGSVISCLKPRTHGAYSVAFDLESRTDYPESEFQTVVNNDSTATRRQARRELGRLRMGDIYGVDDLVTATEPVKDITLVSRGADIISINRRFFIKHASAKLLASLSKLQNNYPTQAEASKVLEVQETWDMYKSALLKKLASGINLDSHEAYQQSNTPIQEKQRSSTSTSLRRRKKPPNAFLSPESRAKSTAFSRPKSFSRLSMSTAFSVRTSQSLPAKNVSARQRAFITRPASQATQSPLTSCLQKTFKSRIQRPITFQDV